jgi:NACalpha-BTF3-like transcription factor
VVEKMAAEDENVDIEDEHAEDPTVKKAAKHDSMRAADLEKVTDYVEEAEILTQNIGDAMKVVSDRQERDADEKKLKETELLRIKVNKEDVDLIVNEMEISRTQAERMLRENRGNVFDVLVSLTN